MSNNKNNTSGLGGGATTSGDTQRKKRRKDFNPNFYEPTSILEDLFYKPDMEEELALHLTPDLMKILKSTYGADIEPWLVSLEIAIECRSRNALLVFFLIMLDQFDSVKKWICECRKPLQTDQQNTFFTALSILTRHYITGHIKYDEYLSRLRCTLLFKTNFYTNIENPLPDKNTHESFTNQFPVTSTTATTIDKNKNVIKPNNLPPSCHAKEMKKLLNNENHQPHLDPLPHKQPEQNKSQEFHYHDH